MNASTTITSSIVAGNPPADGAVGEVTIGTPFTVTRAVKE